MSGLVKYLGNALFNNTPAAYTPDGYFLLDAEVGGQTPLGKQTLKYAVHGTNLLNARYRDYTSLLRYFADQPGLQIMLRLSVHFSTQD